MFRTHLVIGFLAGLLLIQAWEPGNQLLFMALVLIGSALPDIDHPESKVGRKVKVGAMLFEHRGFFHSIFAVLMLFLLITHYMTDMRYGLYIAALPLGYLAHIIADCTTREGIMPFHPLSRMRLNGLIRTGGLAEYVLFFAATVISLWILISMQPL
ncbi:MAG: metal-dependent hydrolase [Candidatus Woesearchaeota archaeon]